MIYRNVKFVEKEMKIGIIINCLILCNIVYIDIFYINVFNNNINRSLFICCFFIEMFVDRYYWFLVRRYIFNNVCLNILYIYVRVY